MRRTAIVAACLAALAAPATAQADPWKDESGHGRENRSQGNDRWTGDFREDWARDWRPGDGIPPFWPDRARAEIPRGYLPLPGECRVWYPDLPPGHQPPPQPC